MGIKHLPSPSDGTNNQHAGNGIIYRVHNAKRGRSSIATGNTCMGRTTCRNCDICEVREWLKKQIHGMSKNSRTVVLLSREKSLKR
jgi:hypothetical protein